MFLLRLLIGNNMRVRITYKRADLRDGVDYSVIYTSAKATTPEQALQEIKQNVQNVHYPAISHAEQIRVDALDEATQ